MCLHVLAWYRAVPCVRCCSYGFGGPCGRVVVDRYVGRCVAGDAGGFWWSRFALASQRCVVVCGCQPLAAVVLRWSLVDAGRGARGVAAPVGCNWVLQPKISVNLFTGLVAYSERGIVVGVQNVESVLVV